MKVLAIDTSNAICSVAIGIDGKIVSEMHSDGEREHSQTLMPMIKTILESNGLSLDEIDLLACGIGPRFFYWY